MKRLCLFCENFTWLPEQIGYSEYTPGSSLEMYCDKGYWTLAEIDEFRLTMLSAQNCKDFEVSEDAKEMGFTE